MEEDMKEDGRKTKCMEKASTPGKMAENTMENTRTM